MIDEQNELPSLDVQNKENIEKLNDEKILFGDEKAKDE